MGKTKPKSSKKSKKEKKEKKSKKDKKAKKLKKLMQKRKGSSEESDQSEEEFIQKVLAKKKEAKKEVEKEVSEQEKDRESASEQECSSEEEKVEIKECEFLKEPEVVPEPVSKVEKKTHTLSIVIPASIIDNAQSFELKTYLVCQIARAAVIYCVDEIIIVESRGRYSSSLAKSNPTEFFVRNLEYLETPPYLRKALFPVCPELKFSGLMNPLNTPHHFKPDEWSQFREGVVINRPSKKGNGSWVSTGLKKDTQVDLLIEEGTRVTVKFHETDFTKKKHYEGTVVSTEEASQELDKYWGYTVRVAENINQCFSDSPYEGGYDCLLGTSDKGEFVEDADFSQFQGVKHALLFFGGLEGIEGLIEHDESVNLQPEEAGKLFHKYLNTCPNQGTWTIRTEEAILISLCKICPILNKY
ncbi:unnamed protein product [Moneuplotes crassus]|uniref:RNA methyltransferase n=1 Tax=Euplotes crassus TaxID=5936 RepID=A0AAD1UQM2_EUPCR|nr:unnamed protein product [Moneuplotes crassus]